MGHRIPHPYILALLNSGNDVPHIARFQLLTRNRLHTKNTYFLGIVLKAGRHKANLILLTQRSVHHFYVSNYPAVGVVHRVEHKALKWRLCITGGRWYALDYCFQNFVYSFARLSAGSEDFAPLATE